ncbi:MAG: hypothetical protein JJU24_16670 [Natronohydrobacter sp.]|nr:hypothetical protein [Natronohydrobacter sp.]
MWFENIVGWFAEAANALAFAQLVAAFVTALATFALWRVTRVLAVETKTLAAMTSRPFVVCHLESSGASAIALNLTLRNTGNATAFDVKLQLSPALEKPDGSPPDVDDLTSWEISLLPPGQALTTQGVMGPKVYGQVFSATVSWAALPGASVRESLSYSFEPKDGFRGGWNTKGLHQIAEELEKLRRNSERN